MYIERRWADLGGRGGWLCGCAVGAVLWLCPLIGGGGGAALERHAVAGGGVAVVGQAGGAGRGGLVGQAAGEGAAEGSRDEVGFGHLEEGEGGGLEGGGGGRREDNS